jgi:hypothetical protein
VTVAATRQKASEDKVALHAATELVQQHVDERQNVKTSKSARNLVRKVCHRHESMSKFRPSRVSTARGRIALFKLRPDVFLRAVQPVLQQILARKDPSRAQADRPAMNSGVKRRLALSRMPCTELPHAESGLAHTELKRR